jgi:hypothetical protein
VDASKDLLRTQPLLLQHALAPFQLISLYEIVVSIACQINHPQSKIFEPFAKPRLIIVRRKKQPSFNFSSLL